VLTQKLRRKLARNWNIRLQDFLSTHLYYLSHSIQIVRLYPYCHTKSGCFYYWLRRTGNVISTSIFQTPVVPVTCLYFSAHS